MTGFSLTEVPVLAGHLALCPLPGADGVLAADLRQVKAWGADLVLTLVEASELTVLLSESLPQAVQDLGIEWRHFPIVDYGVPEQGDWPPLSAELLSLLAAGGRVMVHCRGGCGRTGMIALRLMVDAGEEPEVAFTRLRAARPCAVETEAQGVWATA